MYQFNESHPEFRGFSEYYRSELLPDLIQTELRRKQALAKVYKIVPMVGLVAVVIAALLWLKSQNFVATIVPLGFGAVGATGIYNHILKDVQSETKGHLVGGICKFIGWTFNSEPTVRPNMTQLCNNHLLPSRYDRTKFEDHMSGLAHGATFNSIECHLEREDRDSDGDTKWVTVFRGAVMTVEFPRRFAGRTVVLRDSGLFNSKKKAGMKRVGLVDPKFEKIFEAYGTDQVEARYLLTPDFMQSLVDLETYVNGKKIRFGFLDNILHIVVETENRFEAGSMLKSLTDSERTQKILNEIGAVYDVIDGILKPGSVASRSS